MIITGVFLTPKCTMLKPGSFIKLISDISNKTLMKALVISTNETKTKLLITEYDNKKLTVVRVFENCLLDTLSYENVA